jgi:hypothetical protein
VNNKSVSELYNIVFPFFVEILQAAPDFGSCSLNITFHDGKPTRIEKNCGVILKVANMREVIPDTTRNVGKAEPSRDEELLTALSSLPSTSKNIERLNRTESRIDYYGKASNTNAAELSTITYEDLSSNERANNGIKSHAETIPTKGGAPPA